MKVQAIEVDWEGLPSTLRKFAKPNQTLITADKIYTVLAMSVFRDVWFVLICDDDSMASFVPLDLFVQLSMDMPPEWICNLMPGDGIDLILGPEFIARDLDAYSNIVDLREAAVDRLWEFYDELLDRDVSDKEPGLQS